MNARVTEKRQLAVLDPDNHRFVISPLKDGGVMDIPTLFRAISRSTTTTWRALADFSGLKNSSVAFKVAFASGFCHRTLPHLSDFMVIDADNDRAYFYDKDHRPSGVISKHVGPTILNTEATMQNVVAKVPTKVTTRVVVADILDRVLTMTICPDNGYVLGLNDVSLCKPNMLYSISGSKTALNALLRQIHFVGVVEGPASLLITLDDNENDVASITATSLKFTVTPGVEVSVPSIELPETPTVALNKASSFTPITVEDVDGKLMEFRITPFGCSISGFANYLQSVNYGEVRRIYGRPETINADIANLKITATQKNAQLGMELICGDTRIRQYLTFNVETVEAEPAAFTTNEEVNSTPIGTIEVSMVPTLNVTLGEPDLIEIGFSGTRVTPFDLIINPVGCTLSGFGESLGITEMTTSHTFTGTISQLNAALNAIEVTTNEPASSITISFPGPDGQITNQVITITATAPAPKEEPAT